MYPMRQAIACVAIALLTSSNCANAQVDNESCTDAPLVTLLSNRATLGDETRLYKVNSSNPSTLSVAAYELDSTNGKPARTLWRTSIPPQSSREDLPSRSTVTATLDAVLVGRPHSDRARYANDAGYARFLETTAAREPTLYVTDGRLFSLNAASGQRAQIATSQSDAESNHHVSATLAAGDVRFGDDWRTMLVLLTHGQPATLRGIDITDPDAPRTLWEQSVEMKGANVPRPTIARSKRGWSVIFTAGATLHIRDATTGAVAREIDIDGSSHTLTDPAAADLDRDGIAERIYAGDIQGNLWAFDLSSDDAKLWQVAFEGRPLTTITSSDGSDARIRQRPEVALAPDARTPIVLFTALSSRMTLYAASDRGRPFGSAGSVGDQPGATRVAWHRELGSAKDLLAVGVPRVHDAQVHLILTQRAPDTCDVSTSLVSFSIGDGEKQLDLSWPTAMAGQSGHSGAEAFQAPAQSIAKRPLILDQAISSGGCVRHFYLGTSGDDILHTQATCRKDTFGRQSWRQLR